MLRSKQYNTNGLYFSDRLTSALEKIPAYFLTVIEAPMGYGKTTAVKEYLNKAGFGVLWQTVYDNAAQHFWSDFCQLFDSIDSTCVCSLKSLGLPADNVTRREAVNLIAAVKCKGITVIVIDDYHLLQDVNVHDFITFFVKNKLPNVRIVLTTRTEPLGALDELKLKGLALHITQPLFELTTAEISRYYNVCGVRLNKEDAALLYVYTEGWISALYLCLLDFLQYKHLEKPTNLQELLAKVVYQPLSSELKDFLLRICLFKSFTLLQAQAMWRQGNATVLLRQLMSQNAFIQFNTRSQTYQIHAIFISYLRELFAMQEKKTQQEIWHMAGEWYVTAEDYLAAMEAYYRATDFNKFLDVLELDKGNSLNNEHKEAIFRYFDECPDEIKKKHPIACVLYSRELVISGDIERFFLNYRELTEYIEQIADKSIKNWLLGEMELVSMFTKYNDITAMTEHVNKAYELLPGVSQLSDHNTPWTFGSPSVLYMFYRESGLLQQEVKKMLQAMPKYYKLTRNHGLGVEYVMQAEQYYYYGDFENAEIVSHKALQMAKAGKQIGSIVSALFLQMRLAFTQGAFALVQKLQEEMRAEIKASRQLMYLHTADLCEGFLYAHLKQPENISPWIKNGDFSCCHLLFPAQAYFNMIYGQILLTGGEERKLLGISEHFLEVASLFPNLLAQIYTYIYIAAANEKNFRREQAITSLRQALDLALPDGVIMPFVENYVFLQFLLAELSRRQGVYREELSRIIKLGMNYQQVIINITYSLVRGPAKPKLTKREWDVALLVVEGLSNKEIAAGLCISENTVKTQLKRIFEKLGVNSRAMLKNIWAKDIEKKYDICHPSGDITQNKSPIQS